MADVNRIGARIAPGHCVSDVTNSLLACSSIIDRRRHCHCSFAWRCGYCYSRGTSPPSTPQWNRKTAQYTAR